MTNTLAYIKYPDGHSARIAVAGISIMNHGVVMIMDSNGMSYTTHMSNVVIEMSEEQR